MDKSTLSKFQLDKTKKFNQYGGVMLAIVGLISLILGASLGYMWANIISGIACMVVGGLAVYVMLKRSDIWSALILFRSFLVLICIALLLTIINLIVGLAVRDESLTPSQIDGIQNGVTVVSILSLIVIVVGVGTCAYCAKMYVEDLNASLIGDSDRGFPEEGEENDKPDEFV